MAGTKVAWTRLTDDALLTAGGRSFTTDARFQISPKRQARDWVLIIRRVQLSDEGCYLCEINTEPLSTLIPVYVEVIAENESPQDCRPHKKETPILEQWKPDLSSGRDSSAAISEVMWTRDNNPIDLSDDTKYFTEIILDGNNKGLIYILRIADASSFDDGLYACEGEDSQSLLKWSM
uniref:Ig-like domain-containing protein n=1 Tax=Ditylenchus dipsaci TaxID=166011 RepID=A0A915DMK3_9BILA